MNSKAKTLFERIADDISAVLPVDLTQDVRKNIHAGVRSACESLELVSREELDVQVAVLRRTREKVDRLEAQVAELEKKLL